MSDKMPYFTAFREETPVELNRVRVLYCVVCTTRFMWAMDTDPFFCPWCGQENLAAAGHVRSMESTRGEAEEGQEQ